MFGAPPTAVQVRYITPPFLCCGKSRNTGTVERRGPPRVGSCPFGRTDPGLSPRPKAPRHSRTIPLVYDVELRVRETPTMAASDTIALYCQAQDDGWLVTVAGDNTTTTTSRRLDRVLAAGPPAARTLLRAWRSGRRPRRVDRGGRPSPGCCRRPQGARRRSSRSQPPGCSVCGNPGGGTHPHRRPRHRAARCRCAARAELRTSTPAS